MYRIKTNTSTFYAGRVDFCYKLPSGSPQVVRENERGKATGFLYGGALYNLPGYGDFPEAETAALTGVDAAEALNGQRERLAELETALCEADINAEEWRASVETALCELDEEV